MSVSEVFDVIVGNIDLQLVGGAIGLMFLACLLGVMISFRATPDRYQFNILQAHAFLASAGSLFMMIIRGEIVMAVGLLGAASVVRYRYAIRSPRDAGTLIIALALGMACGSGQVSLAIAAAVFMTLVANLFSVLPGFLPFGIADPRSVTMLRMETRAQDPALKNVKTVLRDYGAVATIRGINHERKGMFTEIRLQVLYPMGDFDFDEITERLMTEDVVRISWDDVDTRWE